METDHKESGSIGHSDVEALDMTTARAGLSCERTWSRRFIDSFKPHDAQTPDAPLPNTGSEACSPPTRAAAPLNAGLATSLQSRHLQMIAIGGSIGTGLFVGSGYALATAGPAAILIAYTAIGVMIFCTVHALGELAVAYPIAGSFTTYATRFLDPAWGAAMGWNYVLAWVVTLPLELVAASITLEFWPASRNTNGAVWVSIFLLVIIAINLFGVRGYGEAEVFFSIIKVLAVLGFIILGIFINIGCIPGDDQGYLGFKFWHDPGAFHNGFKGFCSVLLIAAFSFSGTELVGLAAAEAKEPQKSVPKAVRQVFWRITLFYIIALLLVGILVPYNDPRLLSGSSSYDANASPFVIAVRNAGIRGLPSVLNAIILISAISVGNTSTFATSRTLAVLADQGHAPKIFGFIDRAGRPMVALVICFAIGLLCYLVAAGSSTTFQAFNWMISIGGLATIFTWGSICLAHIRFRAAWKHAGRTLDELSFRSQAGIYGSWFGFIANVTILVVQFWVAAFPLGYAEMTSAARVQGFFQAYLAAPIVLVCYIGFKVGKRTRIQRVEDIDILTGLQDVRTRGPEFAEQKPSRFQVVRRKMISVIT